MAKKSKKTTKPVENKPKPITYLVVLLDKSGSINDQPGLRETLLQGYNEMVSQWKLNAADQEVYASLVTFNAHSDTNLWCRPVEELQKAKLEDYVCEGMTALWNTIDYVIDKLQEDVPVKAGQNIAFNVSVITDGKDTVNPYLEHKVLPKIGQLEATGIWTFAFMGCDRKYITDIAQKAKIQVSNCAVFNSHKSKSVKRGTAAAASAGAHYLQARARGETHVSNLYSADSDSLADFAE